MENRPMFPHAIDSTMLASFRSCPQLMFRQYIEHWKPRVESVHLIAGAAFAKGIEKAREAFFVDGKSARESEGEGLKALLISYGNFECPSDSAKSPERMAGALEYYFDQYPLGQDGTSPLSFPNGKRAIEFSFATPLPINHPETGDPLLYTGRADMIADFAGGSYVFDEKTTSQLGASWSRQWELRSQFTAYCWASRLAGIPVDGAIVRGVSILKTKYETQQVITYRPDWEVDRWLGQTVRDLQRMIEAWKTGYWDYSLDHACAEYGGCGFRQICKSQTPENWLPIYFEKKVWDPLLKKEMSVEEYEKSWEAGVGK